MLFMIMGIICFVVALILMCKFNDPLGILVLCLLVLFVALGMAPISGYEEPVLQDEYELKVIYEPNTYIIEDSSGFVTCKHVIENDHPEAVESYGKYTYDENVEIVVTEKGSNPIMKKYHEKARKSVWTFAIKCDNTKYIFYVPEDNIERWQNVHVN